MKLALRRYPAVDATLIQRLACGAIKARLVSQFCHGGIIIGDDLYQATATHNLHTLPSGKWTPRRWDLFELGESRDSDALALFKINEGAGYDWLGLLAFQGLPYGDPEMLYCFEWCWFAMTGERPNFRVTPEMLLEKMYRCYCVTI